MSDGPPTKREPTPFEKFQDLAKRVIAVPKSEIDKREAVYKRARAARKAKPAKVR